MAEAFRDIVARSPARQVYRLLRPDHEGQVWAAPDIGIAARHMASIVDEAETAKRLANAGQTFIKTPHSPAAVGRLMRDCLVALGLL